MFFYRSDGASFALSVKTDAAEASVSLLDASLRACGEFAATVEAGEAVATVKPPRLGEYTAEWSDGQIQLLEFRSEPYFTAEDLRAYDPQLSDGITDADIAKVREHVEDVFDRASGTAFAPRGAYERHVGNGTNSIRPDHLAPCRVTKCLVDGAEFEGAAAYGWNVSFPAIISRGSVVELWLEYGYRIPPAALLHNALLYADTIVGQPATNPRATGQSGEFGYMQFSAAGKDGATGIPEVDAFLSNDEAAGGHGLKRMVVA